MASFTQTDSGYLGSPDGKRYIQQRGTLSLNGEGASVGDIPASLFGLAKIVHVGLGVLTDNSKIGLFTPSADGSSLLFVNLNQATDANRSNPADTSGDYVLTVIGE